MRKYFKNLAYSEEVVKSRYAHYTEALLFVLWSFRVCNYLLHYCVRPLSWRLMCHMQAVTCLGLHGAQAAQMLKHWLGLYVVCRVFGWTPKNEITNGRWVMFGFAVGLLTEYATGVDFIQQLKLMVSYLGIADIYD